MFMVPLSIAMVAKTVMRARDEKPDFLVRNVICKNSLVHQVGMRDIKRPDFLRLDASSMGSVAFQEMGKHSRASAMRRLARLCKAGETDPLWTATHRLHPIVAAQQ